MAEDEDIVEQLLARRRLSEKHLRKLWASTILIKNLLIKRGFITREEWDEREALLIRDLENKIRETIKKELGLDEEE